MNYVETLLWYLGNIWEYTIQMLPCMGLALVMFCLISPLRRKHLARLQLESGPWRECALLVFVMFSAGLASLTLFPANFWSRILEYLLVPEARAYGLDLSSFYPSWEEILVQTDDRNLFTPFQEIHRGLTRGPWVFFMLLGNIGMFLPIGFFPALLWRKPRWWKSMLLGALTSTTIEFVQFFIGRSTDIDDVILNTTGSLIGYWMFWLLRKLLPGWTQKFQCHERDV